MNITIHLHDRGLGIINGELIKVRNTHNNLGKSVDLILRELVIDLAHEEDAEAQTLYAAQQRLREAWCAFATPFWAGFIEGWATVLEVIGNPVHAVRRWTAKRPAWEGPTITGYPVDAKALRQIAVLFARNAEAMEAGDLTYKSGGIAFSGRSGEITTANLVLKWRDGHEPRRS